MKSWVYLGSLVALMSLNACKTSGDVQGGGRRDYDPSGVKTVESDDAPAASGGSDSAKARVAILEGQIEDIKFNVQKFREYVK